MTDTAPVQPRRTIATPVMFVTLGLVTLFLTGGLVAIYFAYDRQSAKVKNLERANRVIELQHLAIGEQFQKQSNQLENTLRAAREYAQREFERGLSVGVKTGGLPPLLVKLRPYAARGFLVPRRLPTGLPGHLRVDAGKAGFALHWDGISLFANRQPLTLWIMRGYPGYRRTAQVGKRSVHRLLGPYGVVYAWRERQHTYGIVTYPQFDSLAQQLVRAMA